MATGPYRFTFRNYGGIFQVQLETAEDLAHIEDLDRARWAATSAPLNQLFADPVVLKYLDTDHDDRLRVNELIAARRWLWARLKVRDRVTTMSDELVLDHLDGAHVEAAKIRDLAVQLLSKLESARNDRITLAEVRQFHSSYAKTFPNGDGIVTKGQAGDDAVILLVDAIMTMTGGVDDAGGDKGIRVEDLETFLARTLALTEWEKAKVEPLGEGSESAAALVAELVPKMTQFFAQCALVALEDAAAARLQATPEELAKLDVTDPKAIDAWLTTAPLARPNKEAVLPLEQGVNPKFAASLLRFGREVASKVLGKPVTRLTQAEWTQVHEAFAPYFAWKSQRPPGLPDGATAASLAALATPTAVDLLRRKIDEDKDVADELAEFQNLEKLILYQRWLLEIANNFVAFRDLFAPDRDTLFEMGTLVIDGRKVSLCMRVLDKAAHKKIAEGSLIFLIYFELVRREGGTWHKDLVCAGVTAGERGGIDVGKRGVFYDRDEAEWDATVVDVVVQPISIHEAAFAPFRRVKQMVAERVEKFASSKAENAEKAAAASAMAATDKKIAVAEKVPTVAATGVPVPPPPAVPPPPPPPPASNMSTLLIGGGVVFAALGSTLAFIFKTLAEIPILTTLGTLAGVVGGVIVLFGFLGWLKLRRRDMSVLLEACGWALNGRMRLTRELSLLFTKRPPLPKGSIKRRLTKSNTSLVVTALFTAAVVALAWYLFKNPDVLHSLRDGSLFQPKPLPPTFP
jgi:hypothetical protein